MQWKFIQHTINFQASNFLPPEDSMERQIDHIGEIVYEPATGVMATPKMREKFCVNFSLFDENKNDPRETFLKDIFYVNT